MNKIASYLLITLATVSINTSAEETNEVKSKDWVWSMSPTDNGVYYAGTTNAANNLFAQFCVIKTDKCSYVVDLAATCNNKTTYHALISSSLTAESATLHCADSGDMLVFQDYKQIHNIVLNTLTLGIAIARDNGDFTVSRFSLIGAKAAITGMRTTGKQTTAANKPAFSRL